ncbi:MAG: DUF4910 domain-containing protein [Deinococcales bacterium]|nr:DUF4910 domain-containing protein [Deinococcales bacterium]
MPDRAAELAALERLFDRLQPLPRSITGDGVRRTHDVLAELLPLERLEVPSGTQVFDWEVPLEWNVDQAYLVAPDGRRLLDYAAEPLHLVGYSVPFRGRLSRAELEPHLYSLPEQPDAIPYVTSYYSPRWGFCLTHEQRLALPDGEYEVVIDSRLEPGSLTLSECLLPGASEQEVLVSTYTCHPSMANNELSGPLVAAFLYARLARLPERRLSYRFVFAPETIGAIAYLHLRGAALRDRVVAGYVVTCTGGPAGLTYKRSFAGDSLADRAAEHVLAHLEGEPCPPRVIDFAPTGSDERQYNSPGFRLPVGSLVRTMYGTYPEYHTSRDDKAFVDLAAVQRTLDAYYRICRVLDGNVVYSSRVPYGEPQLGRRGLYPTATVAARNVGAADALFWTLNLADGHHDLLAIAARSRLPFEAVQDAARALSAAGLLEARDGR